MILFMIRFGFQFPEGKWFFFAQNVANKTMASENNMKGWYNSINKFFLYIYFFEFSHSKLQWKLPLNTYGMVYKKKLERKRPTKNSNTPSQNTTLKTQIPCVSAKNNTNFFRPLSPNFKGPMNRSRLKKKKEERWKMKERWKKEEKKKNYENRLRILHHQNHMSTSQKIL